MKKICLIMIVMLTSCSTFLKIGTGYKVAESNIMWRDGSNSHPITARIELYQKCGQIQYGIAHHSQWLQGWPINNNFEYSKTEIYIDYVFELGGK